MASISSVLSVFLHNHKANLKILFDNSIYIKTINYDIINKYTSHKFNPYTATNTKNYSF